MAGAATLKTYLKVTGLGNEINEYNSFTDTVPVEYIKGYTVIGTTHQLLDLGDIAAAKETTLYIKAVVGTIYLLLSTAAAVALTTANADIVLATGESAIIPLNPDNSTSTRIVVDGSAETSAISYVLLGSA